ncbi:MAG: GMC family oxidoreductase N-terminal domain-containing protein, partial [Anaerolineales bacterium]|nr:GMC family oxidoreductase N-terminal domain-containing protein [Anaerolineales bacterium]
MIYVRGHPADYDAWAYAGNAGWDFASVLPYFRKSEDFDGGSSQFHGVGGPLPVISRYTAHPLAEALTEAGQAIGLPHNADFNGVDTAGVGLAQYTIKDGQRQSTAVAFLRPVLHRPNLTVRTRAVAQKLLFEADRCVAVRYQHDDQLKEVRANSEIILAAGAIDSPRLLLLSGVGPADDLRRLGIPILADLPGVGQNLQDHTTVPLIVASRRPIPPVDPGVQPGHGQLFWYTDERLTAPDLQPYLLPYPEYRPGMSGPATAFTFTAGHLRPRSRGRLTLRSANPADQPLLNPNYLTERYDVDALIAGLELGRAIMAAMPAWAGTELYPGPAVQNKEALAQYVRQTAGTYSHMAGTCRLGQDRLAVVDAELRLHGVAGLRVVDASVMPTIVSGNINAPVIMIAERAADLIKGSCA